MSSIPQASSDPVSAHGRTASEAPVFSTLALPGKLIIPIDARPEALEQVIPRAGVVAAGDRVIDSGSPRAVRAPVACDVLGRRLAQVFDGSSVPAVEVSRSGSSPSTFEYAPLPAETFDLTVAPHARENLPDWIARLSEAGLAAHRNRSPDLIGQLRAAMHRPVDTVVCNLLDPDPTLPLSSALAANFGRGILLGVSILAGICGAGRAWIVGDARAPAAGWNASLRKLLKRQSIKLISIVNDYPQTDPTLLLYSLLNRRLRPGRLPVEQGVLVLDAASAIAIARCALLGENMLFVPLAIRDHAQQQTHFVVAPLGMQLCDILTQLNISCRPDVTIARGGDLLRDQQLGPGAVVSPSELTIHISAAEPAINPDPCIRCGWCAEACPTRVHPAEVLESAQVEDVLLAERAGVEACIECGICSYVCPSRLPLLHAARLMRERFAESVGDLSRR